MRINKVEFLRKDKNMQYNNNQNQTTPKFWICNLETWILEKKLESSINNQQFVCKEKKKTRTWSKN